MKIETNTGSPKERFVPGVGKVVHNLNGQRLGRKGRETRERILNATMRVVQQSEDLQISLSAIAREADIGMTALYNYFGDLTEALLAVLEGVMAEAENVYLSQLRTRWSDVDLAAECAEFLDAFNGFWEKHANILHLRNNFADQRDQEMIAYRVSSAREIISLLFEQMDGKQGKSDVSMASALYMGIERAVSVLNNPDLQRNLPEPFRSDKKGVLAAEAKLLEFGIREMRAQNS